MWQSLFVPENTKSVTLDDILDFYIFEPFNRGLLYPTGCHCSSWFFLFLWYLQKYTRRKQYYTIYYNHHCSLIVIWKLVKGSHHKKCCNHNINSNCLCCPWWRLFSKQPAILAISFATMGVFYPQQHNWVVYLLPGVPRLFTLLCLL